MQKSRNIASGKHNYFIALNNLIPGDEQDENRSIDRASRR
jgi:hypothetical protein